MSIFIHDLLKKNRLSVTDSRIEILKLFKNETGALAHADIEKKTSERYDRVTIYRNLQTFVEKGIIHTIPTSDNSVKYALCKDECTQGHHHDNHVHFICDNCDVTYCLEQITIPEINMPEGFTVNRADVVVSGICKKCQSENQSKPKHF